MTSAFLPASCLPSLLPGGPASELCPLDRSIQNMARSHLHTDSLSLSVFISTFLVRSHSLQDFSRPVTSEATEDPESWVACSRLLGWPPALLGSCNYSWMPPSSTPFPFPVAPPHSLHCPQSKTECGDLGSPKTTDDIVLDRPEDTRGRRRHKTESVRTPGGTERAAGPESGAQRQRYVCYHGKCAVKSQGLLSACEHTGLVCGCEALTPAVSSDGGPHS